MVNVVKSEKLNPQNWISDHYQYLFNYARQRISNNYVVEEVIQETFLSALESMKNFQNSSSERTWLTSILKHKIVDHYRKSNSFKGKVEKRMLSNEEYENMYFSQIPDKTLSDRIHFDENYARKIRKFIMESVEKLPKRQSKVFKMKVIDNYGTEDICEKLNISPNNAWVLMSRAKRNLALKLKPQLFSA